MGLFMCTDNFCGRYRISFEGPNMLLKTNFSEKAIFAVEKIIWLIFSRSTDYKKPH